jgi:hypothetical protein
MRYRNIMEGIFFEGKGGKEKCWRIFFGEKCGIEKL